MMAKAKWYVGIPRGGREDWEAFRAPEPPSRATFGYSAVIGPFRTRRGAMFMASHGRGNPLVRDVADAERAAKEESTK